jgi:hypothetical protein
MAEKNSLWKNIRNKAKQNREFGATPKKPTTEMLRQERKIKSKHPDGGPVNTLEGDLISKVIMNRNRDKDFVKRAYAVGEYPESNMFVQPDANEFGDKNSHLMSWGEDESGQAYMYPEVMNPNNEAVKVPNQYADYISSTGYKKATGIPHAQGGYMYPDGGNIPKGWKPLTSAVAKNRYSGDFKGMYYKETGNPDNPYNITYFDTPVIEKVNPIITERLEPKTITNIPMEETSLNLKSPAKRKAWINRGANSSFDANGNPLVSEYNRGDGTGWHKASEEVLNQFEQIRATGGYLNPYQQYADGGYTNPYNQYQDDPYLQYKVGGKVWQGIGNAAYGVLAGTVNTVTGGLTKGIMDKGQDALQKAANKDFDPSDPEDVKAMRQIDTAGAAGRIGGSILGFAVSGNAKGAAGEGISGVTEIVDASDASDETKKWTNTIGGLAQTGLSMGSGKGAGTKGISIPGTDGAGGIGDIGKIAGSAGGTEANSIGKIASSAGAGMEMGEDASQIGNALTNFSGSKFGQTANKAMPFAEQAMGAIGDGKASLREQGNAQQDILNSPDYIEAQREKNEAYANQGLMYGQGGNMSNNSLNLRNTMRYKKFAQGGAFSQNGITILPKSGALHHESANGGIPFSKDALAEGGEIIMDTPNGNKFVVSDTVDGTHSQPDFTFSKGGKYKELNRTLADGMRQDLKKYTMGGLATNPKFKDDERRPYGDSYSEEAKNQIKELWQQKTEYAKQRSQHDKAIAQAEEQKRMAEEQYIAAYGGKINPKKYPGLNMTKKAKGGYVHNQMTQPMYAVGGPVYGDPASPYTYAMGGPDKPWTAPIPIGSNVQQGSSNTVSAGYGNKDATNSEYGSRIINEYGNGLPNDTSYIYQSNKMGANPSTEDYFYNTGQNTQDRKPVSNYNSGSTAPLDNKVYLDRIKKLAGYARGGQIDYTTDMYSLYAGGGPMPSNLPQAFDGPFAQNKNGMYAYPDGGMLPPEQQMMQEQQMQQEQMPQQGGQEQMMQMVQQAAQMLEQGAQPEQVMQQLVQAGVPQDVAMQAVQMAMQEMQGQMQQQPMQGEEQMMPQGMAHGGMYPDGGKKVYTDPAAFQKANEAYTDSLDTYNNVNAINKRINTQIAKPAGQRPFSSQAQFKPWMQGIVNTAVSKGDINPSLLQNAPTTQIQHTSGPLTNYTPVTATRPKVQPVYQNPTQPRPPAQQPPTQQPTPAAPQPRIVGEKTQIVDGKVVKTEHLNRQTNNWENTTPATQPNQSAEKHDRYFDESGGGRWLYYDNPEQRKRILNIQKAKQQNKSGAPTPDSNYITRADGGMVSPQGGMASKVADDLRNGAEPNQVLQQLVGQGMSQEQAMAMVQAVMSQVASEMQQQQPQQQMAQPQQMMAARGGYFNGKKQYGNGDEWAPNQDSEGSSGTTFSPLSDESTMSKIAGLGQAVVPALTSAFAFNKLSKRKIKPTTMEAALQNRDAEISALRDEWRSQTESGLRQLRNVGQTAGSVAGNTRELILSSLKEGQKPIMQIYGEMSAANQQAQQQANLANKQATDDFAKENESMYQNAMQTGFEAAGQGVKNASSYYSDLEDRKLQRWQAMNTTGENWTWTPKGKAFRNKDGIYMINGIEVDPSTGNEI